ncbi:MAG: hypothetical protein KDJ16_02255 [Hyphomicrobiales bacterium]|nr:hypothetical protein [Hyphomicrobiales bacterium]
MKSMMRCTIVFFATLAGMVGVAHATPGAAVIMEDRLLGADDRSFFVLRTTFLNPPTYYSATRQLEFLEISVWDGTIRSRCLLRRTQYDNDAAANNDIWTRAEEAETGCDPFKILAERGAAYAEPKAVEDGLNWKLVLRGSAVMVEPEAGGDRRPLLSDDYVEVRSRATTVIDTAAIPWPTGEESAFSIVESLAGGAPLDDVCKVDPWPHELFESKWLFVGLTCWTGDGDLDGARFLVPLSEKTWRKAIEAE